ncbi:uncharacterized protein SCHCODRAFT_02170876 [Schizophyllum commune H4-8]|uniref:uncharacterized protein n=1 Tax=Schizophyllum commune (strain H4-8 / FGSC 9210) TaxID=578458 RepID=UPI002160E56B|nr:uncharacterized protein SCHCODRAFT_02170876 [Schizophyllum commune H4-8]KAI5898678.1 hypothetical protein SCHCODRAFT_02170876 [Schizophyllum commune H4-8]
MPSILHVNMIPGRMPLIPFIHLKAYDRSLPFIPLGTYHSLSLSLSMYAPVATGLDGQAPLASTPPPKRTSQHSWRHPHTTTIRASLLDSLRQSMESPSGAREDRGVAHASPLPSSVPYTTRALNSTRPPAANVAFMSTVFMRVGDSKKGDRAAPSSSGTAILARPFISPLLAALTRDADSDDS